MLSLLIYPRKNSERTLHSRHWLIDSVNNKLGTCWTRYGWNSDSGDHWRREGSPATCLCEAATRRNLEFAWFWGFSPFMISFVAYFDVTKAIARQVMPDKAWAYYSSAADDEITNRENHAAYHRSDSLVCYWCWTHFPVGYGSDHEYFATSRRLTGPLRSWVTDQACQSTSWVFCGCREVMYSKKLQTATALGKLGHPNGELNLTRAAAKHGVIQMVGSFNNDWTSISPLHARFPLLRPAHSTRWSTLLSQAKYNSTSCECSSLMIWHFLITVDFCRYVNRDRNITKRIVQHAEARGIKGLFLTVDAPQLGRREKVDFPIAPIHWIYFIPRLQDMRMKFEAEDPAEVSKAGSGGVDRSQGAARAISVCAVPSMV